MVEEIIFIHAIFFKCISFRGVFLLHCVVLYCNKLSLAHTLAFKFSPVMKAVTKERVLISVGYLVPYILSHQNFTSVEKVNHTDNFMVSANKSRLII